MAHYFFPATYRGISVNDDVGEEFSTLQDAETHATIVANELARNHTQVATVSVLSEDGILLMKVAHLQMGFSTCAQLTVARNGSCSRRPRDCAQSRYLVRLRIAFHSQSKLLKVPSNSSPVNCPLRA
jgi:hypothetical protein